MKTGLRIVIILLAALAVTGVTYAVSQSAWFSQQLAAAPGERGGERRDFDLSAGLSNAAQTLNVSVEELQAALGGMPPNYANAAQQLGLTEDEVRAAVEASLAASGMGRRPGDERGEHREGGPPGGFNAVALGAFGRILLPMALMIGGVTLVRAVTDRIKRRNLSTL